MYKIALNLIFIILVLGLIVPNGNGTSSQTSPTLLKASIIVRANRLQRYWKAPDQDNYWSWLPEMSFSVVGPINTGSAYFIDFTNELGQPWYTQECETP